MHEAPFKSMDWALDVAAYLDDTPRRRETDWDRHVVETRNEPVGVRGLF